MLSKVSCFLVAIIILGCSQQSALAEEQIKVYPLQALFISDKAGENNLFKRAISSDSIGTDRKYAIDQFLSVFNKNFPERAATINAQNRYSTFAVFLQIPRVSQYKIIKSETLADLYLPMTMTISFANMGTGEILYTYTYTYYGKREATIASLKNENVTVELYRDTFNSLLEKVIVTAKENFRPFSVATTLKKEWNGLYILDKGDSQGIVKGDTLIGPEGMPLSVVYASGNYSVAQPIMGEPKVGMAFNKLSNGNLEDLKKPKVMLMPGANITNGANVPEQMIYQLFNNALGKNAAFTLISVDKIFYDAQKVVTQETGLTQAVTQQRELPEYYLRLQFNGPVSANIPSNKGDVSYDEHSVRACGDFLDRGGRVLYGKCVDEKITDEVVGSVRFAKEDREEVVVKNVIIKLADDFIKAVKFKRFELAIQQSDGDQVSVTDNAGLLSIGSTINTFQNIGEAAGVTGDVHVPTGLLSVMGRSPGLANAGLIGGLTKDMPKPSTSDTIIIEGMLSNVNDPIKKFQLCDNEEADTIQGLSKSVYYSVVEGLGYPLYDSLTFNKALMPLKSAAYGFKASKDDRPISANELGYCIEPITDVTLNKKEDRNGIASYNYTLIAGVNVYEKKDIVWKKGLKQLVTITCPMGASEEYVQYELSKSISSLISKIVKQVKLPAKL